MNGLKSTTLLIWLFISAIQYSMAQNEPDYYKSGFLRFEDYTYRENIKTVILEQVGYRLSEPIMELGGKEKLVLSFDDLDGDYKYYSYTLIHCNADWTPSTLWPNEYLQGFTEDRILNYRTSFNTVQKYTHYEQEVPGREVKPFLSGNYILKVYVEGDADSPVLTRRLMVVQPKMIVDATVKAATLVNDRYSKQEVDFSVGYNGLVVSNPFEEVKVVVRQNGRWDNAVRNLKPLFLKDNLLEYDYDEENTFNGGNEFRTFDTRTLRIYTQFVNKIVQGNDGYTVVLLPSRSRSFERYVTENDINGKFLIHTQDAHDSELESEYVKVKFTLKHEILTNGNFYVFGALTDWRTGQANKMEYNYDESWYETMLYLKQGYYDYEYVFLADGSQVPDETIVEGNHYETRNEYFIFVYFRPVGTRYDQLVGLARLYSR